MDGSHFTSTSNNFSPNFENKSTNNEALIRNGKFGELIQNIFKIMLAFCFQVLNDNRQIYLKANSKSELMRFRFYLTLN